MTRSENMSRIRSKETKVEIVLRKKLWTSGIRYRKNVEAIFGRSDIVLTKYKRAIFCDSEFWHWKDFLAGKSIPKNNADYWIAKFQRNMARDLEVNTKLQDEGRIVLRFLEKDILSDAQKCLS